MGYREDKIKVLEIICAQMLPRDVIDDDVQDLILYESDFIKDGISYNRAIIVFKEIFESSSIHGFKSIEDAGGRGVCIQVGSDFDHYAKGQIYPNYDEEIWLEDNADLVPVRAPLIKIQIIIDGKKGIYKQGDQTATYTIKNRSKRLSVIQHISTKDRISISELEKYTEQKPTLVIKEIKAINNTFRKKLAVAYDLIVHEQTGGYSLNKDKFDITFS